MSNALAGLAQPADLIAVAFDFSKSVDEMGPLAPALPEAIDRMQAIRRPLKLVEPDGVTRKGDRFIFVGKRCGILADGLKPLGIKVQGRMTEAEANAWIGAMILALSDLPFSFARKGIEAALHVPFRFLNEIEGIVREKAEAASRSHEVALARLKRFQRQMEAGPALTPPPRREMTDEELQAMPEPLRKIGLGAGWLREGEDGKLEWAEEKDDNHE